MKRRDFIALLSGTAFVPFGLRAQQPDQARKLAVIMAVGKTLKRATHRIDGTIGLLKALATAPAAQTPTIDIAALIG